MVYCGIMNTNISFPVMIPSPLWAAYNEDTSTDPDGYEDSDESPPDNSEDCGCDDEEDVMLEGE